MQVQLYTCTGTWTAISSSDARIRGYKIYANGKIVNTVYNYQIPKFATAETVSKQIGRLTPGTENTVEIVAFTDAEVEYKYPQAQITTLGSYDYKAPVFAENANLLIESERVSDAIKSSKDCDLINEALMNWLAV